MTRILPRVLESPCRVPESSCPGQYHAYCKRDERGSGTDIYIVTTWSSPALPRRGTCSESWKPVHLCIAMMPYNIYRLHDALTCIVYMMNHGPTYRSPWWRTTIACATPTQLLIHALRKKADEPANTHANYYKPFTVLIHVLI